MRFCPTLHDIMACGWPNSPFHSGISCTTNIIYRRWYCVSRPLLDLPEFRVGYPLYRLIIHLLIPFWNYLMFSLIHPKDSGPLQSDIGSVHPWGPWCTKSLQWGGCYVYSRPLPLPALMYIPCLTPTHSFWYPCISWIVFTMMWSRGCSFAPQFMSRFTLQWIYHSSTLTGMWD